MSDKIVFESYGLEFSDEDFEGVDKETLIQCKRKLEETLRKINESK